jgi:hypothetical protein
LSGRYMTRRVHNKKGHRKDMRDDRIESCVQTIDHPTIGSIVNHN